MSALTDLRAANKSADRMQKLLREVLKQYDNCAWIGPTYHDVLITDKLATKIRKAIEADEKLAGGKP